MFTWAKKTVKTQSQDIVHYCQIYNSKQCFDSSQLSFAMKGILEVIEILFTVRVIIAVMAVLYLILDCV